MAYRSGRKEGRKWSRDKVVGEEVESKPRRWGIKDDISWMYGSSCIPNLVC
jgi:hypothetical protein